jgi:mannose-6-phosphate isomerase-like protein (cupin superfamily)
MTTPKRDRAIPPGVLDEKRRTITNQNTGEDITFQTYGYESGGKEAAALLVCKPGGGPPIHYHTTYAERFEAVEGEVGVLLGKDLSSLKTIHLKPGEGADIPIGTVHRFFNDGNEDVTFRGYVRPGHAGFERSLYILFGLNNDGLADPKTGMPHSLLHTALIGDMSDMKFPGFQGGMMNYVGKLLAMYAKWTGVEEELLKKYWD